MKGPHEGMVTALGGVPRKVVEAGSKTFIQVLISAEQAPNFAMRCFTIEPQGGIPRHTNSVEHEQYVLGGSARVGIGGKEYSVKEGDAVFIPAGVVHWYQNDGNEPFKFLCLVPNQPDQLEFIKDR
jgi:quercetin dioxygenase-like cupin family protein